MKIKKGLLFIFLAISFIARSQFTNGSSIKGLSYYGLAMEKELYPPYIDTNYIPYRPGAIVVRPQDKLTYQWSGVKWLETTGLNRIPLTRLITINGIAYDLSMDRSWNIGLNDVLNYGNSSSTGISISQVRLNQDAAVINNSIVFGNASNQTILYRQASSNDLYWSYGNNLNGKVWHSGNFDPSQYATITSLNNYATNTSLNNYALKQSLTDTAAALRNAGVKTTSSNTWITKQIFSDTTFIKDIVPATNVFYSLGTSSKQWFAVYSQDINASSVNTPQVQSKSGALLLSASAPFGTIDFKVQSGNTIGGRFFSDGNLILQTTGTLTNNGAKLQVTGNVTTTGTITTNNLISGTAAPFKIGSIVTGATVTVTTDKYLQVEINGQAYKLAIVQ